MDDDSVLGDVLESDILVGDVGDAASLARDGLDADTVVGVGYGAVGDEDVLYLIIISLDQCVSLVPPRGTP